SACHTHFPELTPTGRAFKLNGYVFRRSESLEGKSPEGQQSLLLNLVAPVSLMFQTSYTSTKKPLPGTQNGTVLFPDQLSLFTGGEITPHVGGFSWSRSEEHTSELQSLAYLVCRLLLEKKNGAGLHASGRRAVDVESGCGATAA